MPPLLLHLRWPHLDRRGSLCRWAHMRCGAWKQVIWNVEGDYVKTLEARAKSRRWDP